MANRQFPTIEGGSPPDAGVSGGHAGKTSLGQFIVIARQKRELRKRRLKRTQGPSHLLDGIQHGTIKTQLEMVRRRGPEIGKWVFSPLHIFTWTKSTSRAKRNRSQSIQFHEESGGRAGDVTARMLRFVTCRNSGQ